MPWGRQTSRIGFLWWVVCATMLGLPGCDPGTRLIFTTAASNAVAQLVSALLQLAFTSLGLPETAGAGKQIAGLLGQSLGLLC